MFKSDTNLEVTGFVSASGKTIINGDDREFLLRGVGLGSWMLPEGYMWRFPENGDRPRRIEKMVTDLLGPEDAEIFWRKYFDTYITEDDIKMISESGFNSVRLPINSRYLLNTESSIERIDRVIDWCRKYKVYIILDLHGAPGGQTGANIDDSEDDQPRLFMDRENVLITIKIWQRLAERYKDEWIVAGYDLLNEPLPEWFSQYNDMVIPLYKEIIAAIREIDKKHMIILEGLHWATDWSIFTEKLDSNMMLQFHKYWNNPDEESLKPFLAKQEELDVPIFMGEGGENNKDWYYGAFQLFEDLNISWNFWTFKKLDTENSPISIKKPDDWELLTDFLSGGLKPDRKKSQSILDQYLDNLRFENCIIRKDVISAILRHPPVRIPAVFYSYKGFGKGYHVQNREDGRSYNFRKNDGVKLGFTTEKRTVTNFKHDGGESWSNDEWMWVELEAGDWLTYEFRVHEIDEKRATSLSLKARAAKNKGQLKIVIDSCGYEEYYKVDDNWTVAVGTEEFKAEAGLHQIKLIAVNGPVRIERIFLEPI